ncbi:MAG: 2-amino-4-hydroxy-6-hydroxymethyldihydropteridine diphosphokinase [Silvibacterium sp.]
MRYTAFIGLGSNLASVAGTPAETVLAAVQALSAAGGVVAQSSLYRTAPVGYREQPYFINAVACIETALEPEGLLRELLTIERSFGRERDRGVPKGPRTLDLDILLIFRVEDDGDAIVCESPTLTVPHPEIANRRFVLQPLVELEPELQHPLLHKTMRQLLRELLDNGENVDEEVRRLDRG